MIQPIRYLTVVNNIIKIYQEQLIILLKKSQQDHLHSFKTKFTPQFKKLQQIQINKSIDKDKVSNACQPMNDFLLAESRIQRTSQSQRYAMRASLKTQDGHRMRFTGGLKKSCNVPKQLQLSETQQMDDIINSYKIEQGIEPKLRMKWKSIDQKGRDWERNNSSTIGDNNINLLSYTIPEIQNSIKRLSIQGSNRHRSPEQIFENYRTIDSRGQNRKKYISRLI